MRFLVLILALTIGGSAFGQTQGDYNAWKLLQSAKQQCDLTAVFVPRAATQAAQAVANARIALGNVPSQHKQMFQTRLDSIEQGIQAASASHGTGDGLKAMADGGYSAVSRRVAAGEWNGVERIAPGVTTTYWKATGAFNAASQGYGGVVGASQQLVQDINGFLSMLEAFEDFYGPIPYDYQ